MRTTVLALLFLPAVAYAQGGLRRLQVWVDLDRLARLHPAWRLADGLERSHAPYEPYEKRQTLALVPLAPVSLTSPFDDASERQWQTEWEKFWVLETVRMRSVLSNLRIERASGPATGRPQRLWDRASGAILQEQSRERAQLRLQLSLAKSEEEKKRILERLKQLDEQALRGGLTERAPLPAPERGSDAIDGEERELQPDEPLVTLDGIRRLTEEENLSPPPSVFSPPPLTTVNFRQKWESLREVARRSAQRFVLNYAKGKNWTVRFLPSERVPDKTEELLAVWRRRLFVSDGEAGDHNDQIRQVPTANPRPSGADRRGSHSRGRIHTYRRHR